MWRSLTISVLEDQLVVWAVQVRHCIWVQPMQHQWALLGAHDSALAWAKEKRPGLLRQTDHYNVIENKITTQLYKMGTATLDFD